MPFALRIVFLFYIVFLHTSAHATHIVGGEMTYKYLGNNQYRMRLDLYIDCINGNSQAIESDRNALFAVHFGNNRQMMSGYPIAVGRQGPNRVSKTNYNCLAIQPNACVDHYWYERTITLAPRAGGYYVSFQRCCRNETITNIIDPGGAGANYWAYIPNPSDVDGANNSAVFSELPPNFLCTNTPLRFDHSAVDADGDSLVYSLTTPYTGGTRDFPRPDNGSSGIMDRPPYSKIAWRNAYTAEDPINGNPKMNIDSSTGYLTLTPTLAGQFVVGISVKEFRNNVFVTETIRDYQFNVQSCVINVMASFFAPKFICGYDYTFTNYSQGAQRYHWDFGVANRTDDTSNEVRPRFTFPSAGKYTISLIAYRSGCSDTFRTEVTVVDPLLPKLPEDTVLCKGNSVLLKSNVKAQDYWWSTGGNRTDSLRVTSPGQYVLGVIEKTCIWYDTINVAFDTDTVEVFGDTLFCSNETFTHTIGAKVFEGATYKWSNNAVSPSITINNRGVYTVEMTTKTGCKSADSVTVDQFPDVYITVSDSMACEGIMTTFTAQYTDPSASIRWSNGATGPTMTTNIKGSYQAVATIGRCSNVADFRLEHFPKELKLGPDLNFCNVIDTWISTSGSNFATVTWNNEIVSESLWLQKPGLVTVRVVTQNGCIETDSIRVFLFQSPPLNLGRDTTICLSVNPTLTATSGMKSYRWNNGQNTPSIIAYDSGLYTVEIISPDGCVSRDSIWINKRRDLLPSEIYMPSAFSPNGDGLNDVYPNNQFQIKGASYRLMLYNRWGEKLADLNQPDLNWDGTINGHPVAEGVYVYQITWIGCDNLRRTMKGDFTLLR
jgi:gliding motility-associated-like protein